MTGLEVVPDMSARAWLIVTLMLVIVVTIAMIMCVAEHYATKLRPDSYGSESEVPNRIYGHGIPAQRRPGGDS